MVFAIGANDYSAKVLMDTYDVNQTDVYTQWEDANGRTHRDVYRKKVVGSFDMQISDIAEYSAFVADVQNNTQNGGYVSCRIAINNLNTEGVQKDLFVSYTTIRTRNSNYTKGYLAFTVEIEER
jgi:hypothetical protein